jgi:hypothetical protein
VTVWGKLVVNRRNVLILLGFVVVLVVGGVVVWGLFVAGILKNVKILGGVVGEDGRSGVVKKDGAGCGVKCPKKESIYA